MTKKEALALAQQCAELSLTQIVAEYPNGDKVYPVITGKGLKRKATLNFDGIKHSFSIDFEEWKIYACVKVKGVEAIAESDIKPEGVAAGNWPAFTHVATDFMRETKDELIDTVKKGLIMRGLL